MSFAFCNSSRDNSESRAKSFTPSRTLKATESEWLRDSKHGLYSLASRLDINFKGLYPDALRYELFLRTTPTRKVKCCVTQKMACRCDYLTFSLFEIKNKKNDKTTWACYFCLKDLVNADARGEMYRYHYMRLYRNYKKPPHDDIYKYFENKDKNMIQSAHYYGVINDDAKAILLDDQCNSTRKNNLFKLVNLFWTIGNAYNTTPDGNEIIVNELPNDSTTEPVHAHVDQSEIDAKLYD